MEFQMTLVTSFYSYFHYIVSIRIMADTNFKDRTYMTYALKFNLHVYIVLYSSIRVQRYMRNNNLQFLFWFQIIFLPMMIFLIGKFLFWRITLHRYWIRNMISWPVIFIVGCYTWHQRKLHATIQYYVLENGM